MKYAIVGALAAGASLLASPVFANSIYFGGSVGEVKIEADDNIDASPSVPVAQSLDLSAITARYTSGLGQPPFDPRMMTALLLNGYASGIYSSRRIAKACIERADFMMIAALDAPDFRTISDFRKRHLTALAGLFVQVLRLAEKAGLVKLGHVALDGTKIKANASKHKAMSYARMKHQRRPSAGRRRPLAARREGCRLRRHGRPARALH